MKTFFKTQIFTDEYETADRLAMDLIRYTDNVLKYRERVYIALSGGNTPQLLFRILAGEYSGSLNWESLHFFWVDERCVPWDSEESNFGNADRILFSKIPIPRGNLHPVNGADDPAEETVRYTGEILAQVPFANNFPVFDLILLGMGDDGHTASIFPGQTGLFDTPSICGISEHPLTHQKRITLTGNVINNAAEIVFMVTGEKKSDKIRSVFENLPGSLQFPAMMIRPHMGTLTWYLDRKAAARTDF